LLSFFAAADEHLLLVTRTGSRAQIARDVHVTGLVQVTNDGAGSAAVIAGRRSMAPLVRADPVEGWTSPPVRIVHASGSDSFEELAPIALPAGAEAACALFHGAHLFIGGDLWTRRADGRLGGRPAVFAHGRCEPSRLGPLSSSVRDPRRTDVLDLPPGVRDGGRYLDGKKVDAMLVDGGDLLAIDNILIPVWVFTYSLETTGLPKPREAREISGGSGPESPRRRSTATCSSSWKRKGADPDRRSPSRSSTGEPSSGSEAIL
jgi:hypothetical protein